MLVDLQKEYRRKQIVWSKQIDVLRVHLIDSFTAHDEVSQALTMDFTFRKANSALQHTSHGVLILPTVVNYSRMLSKLAIGLDKRPDLIANVASKNGFSGDDGGPHETLPERAANIIRQGFVQCLNDRTSSSASGLDRDGVPEGKKRGIYTIANLCLKVLFCCRRTRGAAEIFINIDNLSPPLSSYPKSERVTYLYYLGRFMWINSHFYRAQNVLQAAYDECHPQFTSQRRLILIFLIASNMVCGRFPSQQALSRPEARGLGEKFQPLCNYIRQGNLVAFRRHLDHDSEHYAWFSYYRIDLQLRNRCEVYVWRSIVRKTYLLNGDAGNPEARKAPTVDLIDVLALFRWQERNYLIPPGRTEPDVYIDPDFIGMDGLDSSDVALDLPNQMGIFSKMSSLITQELLNGYLSYSKQKFAIQGARTKGALVAGFPNIWKKVESQNAEEVPGWKKNGGGGGMGGRVVHLSGARPVGSGNS